MHQVHGKEKKKPRTFLINVFRLGKVLEHTVISIFI